MAPTSCLPHQHCNALSACRLVARGSPATHTSCSCLLFGFCAALGSLRLTRLAVLQGKADVNVRPQGMSLLHVVAALGQAASLKLLLAHKSLNINGAPNLLQSTINSCFGSLLRACARCVASRPCSTASASGMQRSNPILKLGSSEQGTVLPIHPGCTQTPWAVCRLCCGGWRHPPALGGPVR